MSIRATDSTCRGTEKMGRHDDSRISVIRYSYVQYFPSKDMKTRNPQIDKKSRTMPQLKVAIERAQRHEEL